MTSSCFRILPRDHLRWPSGATTGVPDVEPCGRCARPYGLCGPPAACLSWRSSWRVEVAPQPMAVQGLVNRPVVGRLVVSSSNSEGGKAGFQAKDGQPSILAGWLEPAIKGGKG